MSKVSIITASYNYEQYIKETIESVIAQTFQDWELIVIDDGSSDNSVEVIKSYCDKDKRIKLFQHKNCQNKGLKETVLLGIEKANSEWIAFLESDDTITPDYLEKKFEVINNYPDVNFIFNDVNLFGELNISSSNDYKNYFEYFNKVLKNKSYPRTLLNYFLKYNIVPTFSCVMIKKDLLKELDYNTPVAPCLDYYLWMQAAQRTKFYFIDEKLTNWRMHKKSYIHDLSNMGELNNAYFNYKRKKFVFKNKHKFYLKIFLLYEILRSLRFRRNIIRIHFKENRFYLFGRWYKYGR